VAEHEGEAEDPAEGEPRLREVLVESPLPTTRRMVSNKAGGFSKARSISSMVLDE
ncbi:unnamed protein product, partial [Amoebophrya sp. A25]